MTIAVIIVWALILGISAGFAMIAIPLLVLALDRYGGKGAQRSIRSSSR